MIPGESKKLGLRQRKVTVEFRKPVEPTEVLATVSAIAAAILDRKLPRLRIERD